MVPLEPEKQGLLRKKLDLSGTSEWTWEQKDQVEQLFFDYGHLFALDSNDLGQTNIVKHDIKLGDYTPFKERYWHIPPHLYEEV